MGAYGENLKKKNWTEKGDISIKQNSAKCSRDTNPKCQHSRWHAQGSFCYMCSLLAHCHAYFSSGCKTWMWECQAWNELQAELLTDRVFFFFFLVPGFVLKFSRLNLSLTARLIFNLCLHQRGIWVTHVPIWSALVLLIAPLISLVALQVAPWSPLGPLWSSEVLCSAQMPLLLNSSVAIVWH